MKYRQKVKKVLFPSLVFLTTLTVGVSVATSLGVQLKQVNQTAKNEAKIDPVQARVQKAMHAGIGAKVSGLVATRYASASDDTNLSSYVGQDIAKIGLENVFTNGGSNSTSGSVYHQETRPNTGVIVVNTNVKSNDGNIQANAYDYVNLKYVQYNKTTGTLTDVLSAPPPSLFANNLWPNWTPSSTAANNDANSTIDLGVVFPTQTILNAVKSTFGFTDNVVTKSQWFTKTNSRSFSLDLSSLFINTIAELFNPNLVWGFGLYDLHTQVISSLSGTKASHVANEILYNGLYRIIANNNALDYFPNPQFNNMPALRYIQANRNKIKAIGDFATYQNGSLTATTVEGNTPSSYFLYLQSLWTNTSTQNYPSVVAIKKWLTETLPALNRFSGAVSTNGNTLRGSITNQLTFQIAISANNIYFSDPNGAVLKTKTPTNSTIPDTNGSWGDLNFASIVLNVSKNLYQIDFSHNQIERALVTQTKFTYINFSNNKLKYVPPLALQPLPWNYLAAAVQPAGTSTPPGPKRTGTGDNITSLSTKQWAVSYAQNNTNVTTPITQTAAFPVTQNLLAPTLQFSNNQILDWWPNNTKADSGSNDGWYTWPNTTSSTVQGEPPVVNSIASTRAAPPSPYNRSTYSDTNYSAYLHRNFLTSRPEGGSYDQSSANLLGDWKNSGYTDGNDVNFYRYYFANKDDNIELISQQNFTTQINYNLFDTEAGKQKPFVLPGYDTTSKSNVSIATFNSGLRNSSSNNVTVNRYYDNLVPYLLGRTLPQNWTTANSWSTKRLNVELLGDTGRNLLSTFSNLDSASVFSALNTGTFTANTAEVNFVKQIIGSLPNGNGTYDSKVMGSSNVAAGIARNLFENQSRVTLNIKQQDLGLNYSYVINVLKNLNYTATALNPKNGDKKIQDIAASSFTKKDDFAIASQISARDLLNELTSWLKTSDYVNLYLINNPSALTIRSYDIQKGEIQVQLDVKDVNGSPITLPDLNNNIITITGFTTLGSSFVDSSGNAISDTENDKLDTLTNFFLPKDDKSVQEWIQNNYQVNYFGLTLKDGTSKTNGPDSSHANGYYKLSELQNPEQYIKNLNVQANSGALSFTIIIPANTANANTPLSKTENLTSFLKFGMKFDTSSYQVSSKQAVYDYQQNPELLKKFVQLSPIRTLNDGTASTAAAVPWVKADTDTAQTDQELQTANLIPKYAKLEVAVASSSNPTAGILNFNVNLLDNSAPDANPLPVLNTQSKTLFNLYNYDSQFSLKGSSTIGSSGVRYINDSSKETKTTSDLYNTLNSYATENKQDDFRAWIQPLVDFSKSAQTYTASTSGGTGTWSPSALSDDQKSKLVYGFGNGVSFTATDIQDNVSFDADANTLSINNLFVKGGYLNGHFYSGTETDAPITLLGSSVYSFFVPRTTVSNISNFNSASDEVPASKWNGTHYQGGNAYFQAGLNQWKDMLPSEWVAQLLSLKNANRSRTVDSATYDLNDFNSLFSFLNHVVNTSTSNLLFQTMVDVSNVGSIQANDFSGIVTIPTKTLLILNNYKNPNLTTPDLQPLVYDEEIKFQLSNYTTRLSEDVKNALPWKLANAVNAQFQAVDATAVQDNLNSLLQAAKKLYDSTSISAADQTAAFTAIEILASNFIADEYYDQPVARMFFTQKFGDAGPETKKNEYTQFQTITYQSVDPINGTMEISVTLKNYISGYDVATNKYQLTDKTETFKLTNLLRHFGTPIWNNETKENPEQTTTSQTINLATTAPELNLFEPGSDTPIFSYQTVSRTEFNNYTAEEYYNHLMNDPSKQLNDYIKLGPDGFQFASWSIVDNYGVTQQDLKENELTDLVAKLKDAEIVVKKSDIHFSARTNQIYFINPVIHFTGNYPDLAAKQAAMANIFDPLKNQPNRVPFGDDNNFQADSLPNITLMGFAKVPTQITAKTSVGKIQLGAQSFNQNEVLPSQIYDWIQNNYSNSTELYDLFLSFYNLTGTSDLQKPITIVLNPAIVAVLNQTNGSKDISAWINFNDGFGTINFKDVFFIFNTFENKNQAVPTENTVTITQFMLENSKDEFSLNSLRKSSFEKVEANQVVQAQISSNIATAMNQLEENNFHLAHQLLMVNEIKTNLVNDESQLEINKVTSNLQSGELVIHYTVRNTYANGQRTNMSGVYILNNFYSPLVPFLQAGLAPLLIGFAALILGVYFINRRYRNNMNTRKYTKKKIANKKG